MLKLTRKSILALEAVLDIAYNGAVHPVQSRDITKRQGIPKRYLENVLQQLVREGILRGVRGPRGGYVLARERDDVTLGGVLRVVSAVDEEDSGPPSLAPLGINVIAPLWDTVIDEIMKRFDRITLEDLCLEAQSLGIVGADGKVPEISLQGAN